VDDKGSANGWNKELEPAPRVTRGAMTLTVDPAVWPNGEIGQFARVPAPDCRSPCFLPSGLTRTFLKAAALPPGGSAP